jgi:hypothetical protein
VRREGRQLLVFASAVENVGRGPLIVVGSRASRADIRMALRQLVRRSDGSTRAFEVAGTLRYEVAETHAHWHLLDFDRYELRDASGGRLVLPSRKTGFCLGDRYAVPRPRPAGAPAFAVYTQECGRGAPRLLRVVQGISVGYGDDYVPELEGQSIDVTGLADGRYVLVHRVNPSSALRERNYDNNEASALVELRAGAARILARCPDSAVCP